VLRPGAIGDTLLTFPALRALRERFPGAELTVVGNRPALEVGRQAGMLDQAEAFGADWVSDLFGDESTTVAREHLKRFDLGVVWMHDQSAATDLARRLEQAGVARAFAATSFPAPGSARHVADHLLDTLAPLGARRPVGGKVSLGMLTIGPMECRGTSSPQRVLLHPGAGGRRKRWPAERFAEIGRRLARAGYDVAMTCGAADEDAVEATRRALGATSVQILANLPLDALAREIEHARRFIGNDSGITHLAAMLGVPTIALFGPYDPAYWSPIGPRVTVLDAGHTCPHRSDPREGCRQCPSMDLLDPETVWEAIQVASAEW
jgi:ADP-heptose:LPS heptosyltransferase